jgi:hypothetical protein
MPIGGVTRQGVELTGLQSLVHCQYTPLLPPNQPTPAPIPRPDPFAPFLAILTKAERHKSGVEAQCLCQRPPSALSGHCSKGQET